MELIQDKNSRVGMIGTILVHLLLLLLFLSFGMPYQDPPPQNGSAMLINFGTSDEGSGEIESEEASSSSSENTVPSENTSAAEEQVLTQNNTEAVAVNSSENQATETETQEDPVVSDDLLNALNAANNAQNNTEEGNQGDTGNSGNQGDPNGDPNSHGNSYVGPIGYSLGNGRGKVSFKKPDNPTQEDGKVVVEIWVNRGGKVIKAKSGARGSTTTNPILQKKAEEAAYKAKFKKDTNAPFEQKGTMTFVFILN